MNAAATAAIRFVYNDYLRQSLFIPHVDMWVDLYDGLQMRIYSGDSTATGPFGAMVNSGNGFYLVELWTNTESYIRGFIDVQVKAMEAFLDENS